MGCHHCKGVLAYCHRWGFGCEKDEARSLELARESSGRGSRYGQIDIGELHYLGEGGLAEDYAQAVAIFWLAAAQRLDLAQFSLGCMYFNGNGVAKDRKEGLRWFQLAAAQGYPEALYYVASCHEHGYGVRGNMAAAILWYNRAQAAGNIEAAAVLQRLGA